MPRVPLGSVGGICTWRFKTLNVGIAKISLARCVALAGCFALAGCVAQHAKPDIAALSPDLETPELKPVDIKVVSNDKKPAIVASSKAKTAVKTAAILETKPSKPLAYQFVAKASFDLPALNREFPSTFGFSGNNIDHLLLGGGASWQSQPTKNAGRVTTPLVLNGGRLFYGDDRGGLYAVSASNGALLWAVHLSDGQSYQPIATLFADKEALYAATRNGHVIAIASKDGTILWKKKVTGAPKNSVTGALRSVGGALLLKTGNNQLLTLSKDNGEAGWVYKSNHSIDALAVSNGTIQLLTSKNEFVHLEQSTGKQKTKNEFSGEFEANQLLATPKDLIVSGKSGLSRYTPQRTQRLWEQKKGGEGRIIASGDTIFSSGTDNALRAFNRTNGKLNWRSKLPENKTISTPTRWSRPILAGGRLHLASNTGYVASFNADDGKLILLRNIKAPLNSAPIVASGRLYIVAADGRVYRL